MQAGIVRQSGLGRKRRANQRGISLLEVLVVLVILVFGIFSIIRIFPGGFFAIRSAENNTFADRLGQSLIQSLTKNNNALPEAILTSAMYTDGSDPDKAETLNNARYIQNEALTVPSVNKSGQSVYVADFGPIVDDETTLSVNGAPWTPRLGNSASGPTNPPQDEHLTPQQTTYQVDLNNKKLAIPFPPPNPRATNDPLFDPSKNPYPQKFVLIVQAFNTTTNLPETYSADLLLPVTDNDASGEKFNPDSSSHYNGNWFDPTDASSPVPLNYGTNFMRISPSPASAATPSGANIIWQSVTLYRPFKPLTVGAAFSNDPCEYTTDLPINLNSTSDFTDNGGTKVNLGAIAFNPRATPAGYAPLKATLSYYTYNWHILHEDRDVPDTSASSTLRLTLGHLKKIGAVQFDNTIYNGLLNDGARDILILDTDSGQVIDTTASTQINDIDQSQTSANPIQVSYAGGRIILPSTYSGKRVRIFYAGDAEWGVAIQKAPSTYTRLPDVAGSPPADPVIGAVQCAFEASSAYIYFPRCDAGKMVEVDGLSYTYPDKNNQPQQGYLASASITLSQALTPIGVSSYAVAKLINPVGESPLPLNATNINFKAVRGVSARAIVVWKETDVWKVHTVDTLLTRSE